MRTDDFIAMAEKEQKEEKEVVSIQRYNTVVALNKELEQENIRLQGLLDNALKSKEETLNALNDLKTKYENEENELDLTTNKIKQYAQEKERIIDEQKNEIALLRIHIETLQSELDSVNESEYKEMYEGVAHVLKMHLPDIKSSY